MNDNFYVLLAVKKAIEYKIENVLSLADLEKMVLKMQKNNDCEGFYDVEWKINSSCWEIKIIEKKIDSICSSVIK